MDLWQYFGYLKAGKEKRRDRMLYEEHHRRQTILAFALTQAYGNKESIEKFFSFEEKIHRQFEDKAIEKADPIAEFGAYEIDPVTGEEVWVYTYQGILEVEKAVQKFGGRRR